VRTATVGMLEVPGARLRYEVRGAGPVLLLIHGGMGDAGVFAPVAGLLADSYTVLTYDRRGNSRSPLVGAGRDTAMLVEQESDDARRLLDAVGGGPAYVLGSSSGAVIGLDLLAGQPQAVARLVAHEPPVLSYLPDGEHWIGLADEVRRLRETDGDEAAMARWGASLDAAESEAGAEFEPGLDFDLDVERRMMGNVERFLTAEVAAVVRYRPDLAALAAAADKLVVGVGEESREQYPARAGRAVAAAAGVPVAEFPSQHWGYLLKPRRFADALRAALG
jgi:pimeloyl-ACP methyl ester carboxylesterase